MSGVNKVILVGNLGADPELKTTPGGQSVCSLRVATTESWNDKDGGGKKESTEWHRVVVWGKLADLCGQYLSKGRQIYLEGKLQTREWTDKEGQKRFTTEINARQVVFLAGGSGASSGKGRAEPPDSTAPTSGGDGVDDDLPF